MVLPIGSSTLDLSALPKSVNASILPEQLQQLPAGDNELPGEDRLNISNQGLRRGDDGQRALQALLNGQRDLRQSDVAFLEQRVNQLQEELTLIQNLRSISGPGQREILDRGLEDLGARLSGLGSQINIAVSSVRQQLSLESVRGQANQSFNGAVNQAGDSATYRQELNAEFSFLQVSATEQTTSLSISEGENGEQTVEISQTTTQSELVVAQASVERTQTLSVQGGGVQSLDPLADRLESLSDDYQKIVTSFTESLEGILAASEEEDRIPPGFIRLLETLQEKAISSEI